MTQIEQPGSHDGRDILPIYRPSGEGTIVVYAGDLLLAMGADEHVTTGNLELQLSPRPAFFAHVAGSDPWLIMHAFDSEHLSVALPPGASIDPPAAARGLAASPEQAHSWADFPIPIKRLAVGEVRLAERLILHISGPLSDHPLPAHQTESSPQAQPQLPLTLPGWDLRLAKADEPEAVDYFSFVVDAIPRNLPLGQDATERLSRQVFTLLSLVAGQEIGVGPLVGLNAAGRVVWAEWYAPRFRPGQSPWRWCPKHLVNQALPVLAIGLSSLADDLALQAVVDRAVNHLLAANGPEVVDVRIPVACSGLELLGWAVLQRHQWLIRDGLGRLPASARVRLLLHWAGIPPDLPDEFGALAARRGRLGQQDLAGPELVFDVRNDVVHPPKRIQDPEWPGHDELVEAWQIATWYLELAIVRLLGYEGHYLSRLRLDRWVGDEPVPWSASHDQEDP